MNIAIAGRPNVGKSALFNRIAGRRIAIVHGQPGITRDRISAKCEIGGKTFRLWDTGGIVGAGETQLTRSEEHTSELQSQFHIVCRRLLEKKKKGRRS